MARRNAGTRARKNSGSVVQAVYSPMNAAWILFHSRGSGRPLGVFTTKRELVDHLRERGLALKDNGDVVTAESAEARRNAGTRARARKGKDLADDIPWKYHSRVLSGAGFVASDNLSPWETADIVGALQAAGHVVSVEENAVAARGMRSHKTVIRASKGRANPALGDYLAAGRRHLATGLTKAAEEAQRAAERARAAAEREAKRRQCDAPTPEQALRVLAQAIGVEKLNPRHNNGARQAAIDWLNGTTGMSQSARKAKITGKEAIYAAERGEGKLKYSAPGGRGVRAITPSEGKVLLFEPGGAFRIYLVPHRRNAGVTVFDLHRMNGARKNGSDAGDYDRFLDAQTARRQTRESRAFDRAAAVLDRKEREAEALIGHLQRGPKLVYYINLKDRHGRFTGKIKEGEHDALIAYLIRNKYV